MSGPGKLLVETDAGVARITFDNPGKHNALSVDMRAALPGVLQGLQDDPAVRVIVVVWPTPTGLPSFLTSTPIRTASAA